LELENKKIMKNKLKILLLIIPLALSVGYGQVNCKRMNELEKENEVLKSQISKK